MVKVPFSTARVYATLVSAVGLAWLAVLVVREGLDVAWSPAFWAFTGLIVLAELRPIYQHRVGVGTVVWSLSTPFMFALLLYKGAAVAALVSAAASVVADTAARRGWDRVLFNAGQYVIALGFASLVLTWTGYVPGSLLMPDTAVWTVWPVFPAAVAFLIGSELLVATVLSLDQGEDLAAILWEELQLSVPIHGVLLALAPVIAVLAGLNLVLMLPMVILVLGIHQWTKVMVEKEHQADHDTLTGLPNRSSFRAFIQHALDASTGVTGPAVLLFDLNSFKDVNDTLGHLAGDELLKLISRRLTESLGWETVVARLGGDEFAILLPSVDGPDAAVEAAVGIMGSLHEPVALEGFSLDVSASAGIATYPEHGRDADTLLRRAEIAMYVAKEQHGGIEIYRQERDGHSRRRLSLAHDLRKAVEAGDLTVAYQPKADVATGEIVGMEALVRWDHPEHGPVSPDEFIPLAERTGLIAPITAHVLEVALDDCALWHRARFALGVAVNYSPVTVYDRALQRTAGELVRRWSLDPSWLGLEITESTIMADPDQARQVLNNAADLGVRLSIDDFGTGYSSLGLLKQLPVHELKIDRSFAKNIVHDQSDAAIVHTTIQLAHSLGMTVCAEGVETMEAWQRLVELDCDLAQGYLLTRALPGPQLMAWLFDRVPGPQKWAPTAALPHEQDQAADTRVVAFTPRRSAT
jgi:diguanylate cyclase (GGDEF)-like protein